MLSKNKGIALIGIYMVIIILLILGAVIFTQSYTESKLTQRHKLSVKALCIAEAGIERALYELKQDYSTTEDWYDGNINGTDYTQSDTVFYTMLSDVSFGGGTYTVSLRNIAATGDKIWVRSTGNIGGVSRTIQTYVKVTTVSVWDNAIFAGAGASGTLINGNVDIRGSVHILGTGLNIDDLAVDMAIDLGGSASIGNNYEGMDSTLAAKIPELDTTIFGGQEVYTLNAELRVKQGMVGLSGSATVGDPNDTDNDLKETLDGVYVTDGFGGNQGANNVYSDNGTDNEYDLGDSITFPSLSDSYGGYARYKDYLRANAYVISDQDALNNLANITPTSNFNYSGTNGSISISPGGNLVVSGIVYVDGGDLNITGDIYYAGSASILVDSKLVGEDLVGGSVTIAGDLLTPGTNSFPDNILGIMAEDDITFTTSQINVMGLFYAEDTITATHQTDVLGTFVSNYFDMGSQVPSIYQVPEAADNLPPGMIGGVSFSTVEVVSWQEIQ